MYKQATAGPCTAPKPGFFDRKGRAKRAAWQAVGGISSGDAQQQYVALLTQLVPGWAGSSAAAGATKRGGAGGPVQSRMAEVADEDEVRVGGAEGPGSRGAACMHLCSQASPCSPCCPQAVGDASPSLLQAARVGHAAAVELNLAEGADVNQRGGDGETALHWAADRGQAEVMRLLLARGADVNAADADGLTPLHYAALAEQREAAELLAAAPGARLDARSADGKSAADVAPPGWEFLLGGEEAS